MIESLAPGVQDVATLVVLFVPGFVFISVYESVNIAAARLRSAWEWTMRSLAISLPLFAVFSGVYDVLGWPNEPTEPSFYLALFSGSVVSGYLTGWTSSRAKVRGILRGIGVSDPQQTWIDVVGRPDSYVVVHLVDGTVIYGYPSTFSDDPREDAKELFLTEAAVLRRKDETDPGEWEEYAGTEGILVESQNIKLIQLIEKLDSAGETPNPPGEAL